MDRMKQFIKWMLFVGAAIVVAACGPQLPDQSSNSEATSSSEAIVGSDDSLVIGVSAKIDSYNPFQRTGFANTYAQRFFYETLLDMTGPTEFEPRLGEITTDDNQVYTIKIHPDANWSDGEAITTEDVKFSIDTTAHPDTMTTQASFINMIEGTDENGKTDGSEVTGVEIIDDKVMTITTKQPVDINYFSEFFGFYFFIAPEHVYSTVEPGEIMTADFALNPEVFSGAYKVVDYQEGNHVELAANEDYYQGAPKIKSIFMRTLEETAMMTELQSGQIDMLAGGSVGKISHNNMALIRDDERFSIEEAPGTNVEYLMPNSSRDRWNDPRVRQAVAYATDRQMMVDNLLLGNGEILSGPFTSSSSYLIDDIEPFPYDVEKAKELLEEANFDFETPVTLMASSGNESRDQASALIKQQLEAVGMTVEIVPYDITTWIANAREKNFDIGHISIRHNYDPDVSQAFHTTGSNNFAYYTDEKLDSLLMSGTEAPTFEERYSIYEEFQKYFAEEMPMIPLYTEFEHAIQKKNIKGGVKAFWPATTADLHEWEFTE